MLDYLLIIYLGSTPHYVGTFPNCQQAEDYVRNVYPMYDSACQHRDYIYLPKKLKEKYFYEYPSNQFAKTECSVLDTTDYPCMEHKGCE